MDAATERQFERFFDDVWLRAKAVGARMGMGSEEAEDVALDALAVAYDRWRRIAELPYREAWVLRVAANLALRRLKRRRAAPTLVPLPTRSPEDEVTARLAVSGALARLPRRQREVVVLRYLADLPVADVARLLGIDAGSVKQHASRARLALLASPDLEEPHAS